MATTLKSGLFVPEIATEIASAEFPNRLALGFSGTPFVQVLPAFENLDGDTVKFPRWGSLSAMEDLTEDVGMTAQALSSAVDTAVVIAGGKMVEITDFAQLAAFGDPSVEAGRQMAQLAADYVDTKLIAKATATPASASVAGVFTVDAMTAALYAVWGDKAYDNVGGMIVHSKVAADIQASADFKSAASTGGLSTAVAGLQAIGTVNGYPLYVNNKVTVNAGSPNTYSNLILKRGALGVAFQRQLLIETERDISKKSTIIASDVRFAVHQFHGNPAKVMKLITQ